MEKMFRQIGNDVVEYTTEEYAQVELDKIESQRVTDDLAAKAAEKDALLAKLGMTPDEAKLLLS